MDYPPIAPDRPEWWLGDVDAACSWLRDTAPVLEYRPNWWTVSRYDDIRAVSCDPQRFSSAHGVLIDDPVRRSGDAMQMSAPSILSMDPPDHARYRKLATRAFTPRAVARMEERIRTLARHSLDSLSRGTEHDFVEAIAAPLPLLVIAELLGMSDVDPVNFRIWSDEAIKAGGGEHADMHLLAAFIAAMNEAIDAHRAKPRDDVLQLLVDGALADGGDEEPRPLDGAEVLVYCMALLVAGNETTRNLISGGLLALHEHRVQRTWLVEHPDRIGSAVEELLRWVTPIKAMCRTAVDDVDLGGAHVAAGDTLVLLYPSGNRDDSVFGPTASRFDVARVADAAHVAFGFGEHLCLGAALARLETRVLFEELLTRFPDYQLTAAPTRMTSTLINGWSEMPGVLA